MAYDLKAAIAAAAKTGPNMNEVQGGGEYTPPAAGIAWARFVGYYEIGLHEKEYEGRKSFKPLVELVFELSGPNHEPAKLPDGTRLPARITSRENISFTAKSHFFKLFAAMNYAGKATHMAELLGEAYVVEIFHGKSPDGKKTYANLRGPNGYNVKGTTVQDPLTGAQVSIPVGPPLTDVKAFIWDIADKSMWDSIYIPGEYPERKDDKGVVTSPPKSKNVLQNLIMTAQNWPEHPLCAALLAGGVEPDLPDAETPERAPAGSGAAADPLASLG